MNTLPAKQPASFLREAKESGVYELYYIALENGMDIKTVSSMLGHYSAGFTLDTYTHVTTPAQMEAANTMGTVLSEAIQI